MPIYSVQGPDGKIYDVQGPEGATADQLAQVIQQSKPVGNDVTYSSPGMDVRLHYDGPPVDAPSGGIGGGVLMGMRDPIDAGAQMLRRAVPDSVGTAVDSAGQWLHDLGLPIAPTHGVQGVDNLVNGVNAGYEANRADAGRSGFDLARMGGNVIGAAPIVAASGGALGAGAPLAARLGLGAAQGGLLGEFSPVVGAENQQNFADEKTKQGLLGGVLGGATPVVTGILGRAISPVASRAGSDARTLMDAGVTLTPGQLGGGTARALEDKAMSVPLAGDAIAAARRSGVDQLNRAVYSRVLSPIGGATTKIGRGAVDDVSNQVSQAYDDVLKNVQFSPDNALMQDLTNVMSVAKGLPDAERNSLMATIQKEVVDPLSMGRAVDGQTFKDIESQLGQRALKFARSTDVHQQDVGDALREAQGAVRRALVRQNPQAADRLSAINQSFSMLTRLQNAASRVGATDGVFTPAQLSSAVRSGDLTVRKNAYARGNALMQDLSDAARNVMGPGVPDSGTAGRSMLGLGLLGGAAYNPAATFGTIAALGLPYLPGLRRIAPALVGSRPAGARALAGKIQALPPGLLGILTNAAQ